MREVWCANEILAAAGVDGSGAIAQTSDAVGMVPVWMYSIFMAGIGVVVLL